MLQLHVTSIKEPTIYRKFLIHPDQTFLNLEEMIMVGFDIEDDGDFEFKVVRKNGKPTENKVIVFIQIEDTQYDAEIEKLNDWFIQAGDEIVLHKSGMMDQLRVQLEQIVNLPTNSKSTVCIAGKGNLPSNRNRKVDLDEVNMNLKLLETIRDEEFDLDLDKILTPDYLSLLEISDELKKARPWNYLENEDIIALKFEEYDEVVFVSVMGAAGQEFGLMVYDEDFGYASLSAILSGKPLSEDFAIDLNALTVNFVDRSELNKEDYQLIKDCGLTYRGKKNWIQFRSYQAGTYPEIPLFSDVERLSAVVSAMLNVTELFKQGWRYPVVEQHKYLAFDVASNGKLEKPYILEVDPVPQKKPLLIDINDIEKKKFKNKPKAALQIEYDLFYLPYFVEDEDNARAIYPLLNIIMDRATGEVLESELIPFPKIPDIVQRMFWEFLKGIPVRPGKIYVTKDMMNTIYVIAKAVGIELVESELPNVTIFKEMLKSTPPTEL